MAAGAMLFVAAGLCGISHGYTCPGSEAAVQNQTGSYVLGMPMGGIGGGNFNFLPDGNYNQTYIRVASAAGAAPLCIAFAKRGTTVWSSNLVHAGTMTTTFTGYWPTVIMKYLQTGMLDTISLECLSPICAGDNKNSSLPLCIYIFTIRNTSTSYDTAAIALSNSASGTIIISGGRVIGMKSSTICVMVDTAKSNAADSITCGTTASDFTADGIMNTPGTGGILAKRVIVAPSSSRTITFTVAWTNVSNGYYRNYFTDAQVLATHGRDSAVALKAKVDNWHNKILNSNLPDWLKDLVINSCHTYNSMTDWTNSGTYGTYGMAESMSSGNYGCIDQSYHGSMALPIFAPDAAWSEVGRIAGAQLASGLISHLYGGGDNAVRSDGGAKLTLQAYRNYLWTGNATALTSVWTNVRNAITAIRNLDARDNDGLADDSDMNTYDNPYWDDWMIPEKEYDNELDLAALKAAAKIAVLQGRNDSATSYTTYFTKASTGFERNNSTTAASSGFWDSTRVSRNGRRGYYTASTNINCCSNKGQACWSCMFEGQWYADFCGLGTLHPESRIQSALNYIQDVNFDPAATNPSYILMGAQPPDGATRFQQSESPGSPYVSYVEYPAGELGVAFQHNLPNISMKALNMYWYITYSKFHRVYNVPCKVAADGSGAGWGIGRYMFPPGVFASLFSITGFTPDVAGKTLHLKPSLPTGMDSLIAGPLMNPVSLGTVDYRRNTVAIPNTQRFVVRFDSPMQFNTFYAKKLYAQTVSVTKPAVSGSAVAATIAVNTADTSEYQVTFGSTLTIDNTGVLIIIGGSTATKLAAEGKISPVELTADMKRGTLSYVLPQRMKVNLVLVDDRGVAVMRLESEESAGQHVVRPEWKNMAAGIYYAHFKAGDASSVKKLVYVR